MCPWWKISSDLQVHSYEELESFRNGEEGRTFKSMRFEVRSTRRFDPVEDSMKSIHQPVFFSIQKKKSKNVKDEVPHNYFCAPSSNCSRVHDKVLTLWSGIWEVLDQTASKEVIGMGKAVWKSGSCDWLMSWANNLTSELQPQGPDDTSSFFSTSLPLSSIPFVRNGLPPLGSQPQPGSPEPCGSQVHPAREAWLRFAGCAAIHHPVYHPLQRIHRTFRIAVESYLDGWRCVFANTYY